MSDYFPLVKGAVREYETETARSSGTVVVEVLEVATADGVTTARCRRTVTMSGEPATVAEFTVVKNADGASADGIIEFRHPLQPGTEWIIPPRRYWIEALDAIAQTPAGRFTNCLRVAYLIAEGDGGSGERFYAPGVGLVLIGEHDESDPFTYRLVRAVG